MPRAAAAIAVAAWGLAVLAVVLAVAARAPVDEGLWFFAVDVTVACVYGTVASVILARRRHPVPWLLALAAVGGGLAALGFGYRAFGDAHPGIPALEAVGMLQGLAWVPGTLALFLVVPWLVRDHPLGRAVWGVVAGATLIVALVVCQVAGLEVVFTPLVTAVVVLGLVTSAAVERRHRHGPVAERNGLGWLALGSAVLALSFVPLALPPGVVDIPVWVTPVLHLASQAVYPAAVLVAVLRGRMWGLQLAVSRTVLAGLMTVTLTVTYVAVTWLVTRAVPGSGFAQLVGAAVVAVAVQPARFWLERRVHRLVHGTAAAPDHVVRRIGSHLSLEGSAEALLGGLAEDVGTAMRLESVTLTVPGGDDVVWGVPSGPPVVAALRHRGEEVGTMAVTLPGGDALGSAGQRTLRDRASVVAAAVAVTRAAREVEESRQRLASARLAERRVIRRGIHDGLGPSLAGLRLGLRGARNLLDSDPAAAAELLATLQDELDQRVADVRTMSHHLLPPVLDELGLGAALQELSARYAEDGLTVRLDLDHEEVADPQVAAAAYGIIGEALVNVSRHSGVGECTVRTATSAGLLSLMVSDQGRGIGEDARAGVGSRSMRERAEEQGGRLEIHSSPGAGTSVQAELPLQVVRRG